MEISRLGEFLVLAETLNYGRAAKQLFITQPVLSRHISELEHQLGVRLFSRDTHQVALTQEGKMFVSDAGEILAEFDAAVDRLKTSSATSGGRLAIAFMNSTVKDLVSDFISVFSRRHPDVALDFRSAEMSGIIRGFDSMDIDICFTIHVDGHMPSFSREKHIITDRECVLISKNHRLAGFNELDFRQLEGERFIYLNPATDAVANDHCQRLIELFGLSRTGSRQAVDIDGAIFLADINEGVLLIPKSKAANAGRNTRAILLSNPECRLDFSMMWHKDNENPALALLVREFGQFCMKEGIPAWT